MNNKRLLLRIVVIAILVSVAYVGLLLIGRVGKVTLLVDVAPQAATVRLDGKPTQSSGKVFVSKGKHVVAATLQGFQTATKTINASGNITVTITLQPADETGTSYLLKHPEAQTQIQTHGDIGATNSNRILREKYPYLNQLPILTSNFTVYQAAPQRSRIASGDAAIALDVTALNPTDRARAVERIRTELGIDPSTVEILFENSPNIFARDGE